MRFIGLILVEMKKIFILSIKMQAGIMESFYQNTRVVISDRVILIQQLLEIAVLWLVLVLYLKKIILVRIQDVLMEMEKPGKMGRAGVFMILILGMEKILLEAGTGDDYVLMER